MGDKIVLNTPQFKGEYDFDIIGEPLTGIEWRWVKKISDYLPLTIEKGLDGGDPDLFIAFAVIALFRAGRIKESDALLTGERLAAAPVDGTSIVLVAEEREESEEEVPPSGPAIRPDSEPPPSTTGSSGNLTLALAEADRRTTGALG